MFVGYYGLRPGCPVCRLPFERAVEDHLGVIYITTAIQTAGFAAIVLLYEPSRPWLGRGILAAAALGLMLLNLPNRKGLAVAIDYLTGNEDPGPKNHCL
jgi:uncharacterized protein (DUF983 family)